jgi:imidazolonepropionase-like amidohydrolase
MECGWTERSMKGGGNNRRAPRRVMAAIRTRIAVCVVAFLLSVLSGAAQPAVEKNVIYGMHSGLALLLDSFPLIPITAAPVDERRRHFEVQLAAVRSLREAGARFIAGRDASGISLVAFGLSLHRELELLVDIGLTPSQALAAATSTTARAFRLRDRGRIQPGGPRGPPPRAWRPHG